ncbi:MAG TPA: RNA polymerase sigma factor SigF [Actinomycetes bacterium]|nr:RNA polymerase sigma factor SigF [Actinomycetes bacterium]
MTELPSETGAFVEEVVQGPDPSATVGGRGIDRAYARELFRRFAESRDASMREELVGIHLPLVEYLARRFRNRGEPLEDLVQVGTIGLLKAIDRFDLEREVEFSTYATPTIVGELKRHFRDKGWAVRVPRRLQELNLSLTRVVAELSQEIGRSPTVREIADRMHLSEEEVLEGLDTSNAYAVLSLDAPSGAESTPSVSDHIGVEDETLETLEYRAALGPIIAELPERERHILYLRFFRAMTQSQIAERLGISQMHVSRLLNRTLVLLRERLLRDESG